MCVCCSSRPVVFPPTTAGSSESQVASEAQRQAVHEFLGQLTSEGIGGRFRPRFWLESDRLSQPWSGLVFFCCCLFFLRDWVGSDFLDPSKSGDFNANHQWGGSRWNSNREAH